MENKKRFALIKYKNRREWVGAILLKPETVKATLNKGLPKNIRDVFAFKIVSASQLQKIIIRQRPRGKKWTH